MKLLLYIEGKKADIMGVDYVTNDLFHTQCLIKNAIERLKLENQWKMRGKDWEIFMVHQSKMNESNLSVTNQQLNMKHYKDPKEGEEEIAETFVENTTEEESQEAGASDEADASEE